jgi:hypothetical protein
VGAVLLEEEAESFMEEELEAEEVILELGALSRSEPL